MTEIALTWFAALGISGALGWRLGPIIDNSTSLAPDMRRGWLRSSPLTPMLVFISALLPFLGLPLVIRIIILTILCIPPIFIFSVRFHKLTELDTVEAEVNRRALLQKGWYNIGAVAGAFLITSAILYIVSDEIRLSIVARIPILLPGLLIGAGSGAIIGLMLFIIKRSLDNIAMSRYQAGQYAALVDGTINLLSRFIGIILTQFHHTAVAGVLVILAVLLPFTPFNETLLLALFILPPIASAVLAAQLVHDPAPGQPGFWQHIRWGLWNIIQVSFSFLVGAALLVPLGFVYRWAQTEPEIVNVAMATHLDLTFTSLFISIVIGVLGGILSARFALLQTIFINLGNLGRTLPSLAVLALALPLFGVGRTSAIIALVVIGALPILVNTTVGISNVSPAIKEAARGMGMSDIQVLLRVEIPIAMPVIMAGVRTSAVLIVASAALAGFIGGKGLGELIYRGDSSGRDDLLIAGAVLSTMLAIFLEYLFSWLEKLLTPRGLQIN